jgi:hypothetical protein
MLRTILAGGALVASAAVMGAGPAAAVTPTQSTIDGKHPSDMGCRADQKVIYHTLIMNGSTTVGYVDLMASTYCHAVWAHIHGTHVVSNQTWVPQGHVHRNSDGKNSPTCFGGEGTQDCYTTMLWDKGVTSYAYGAIDPNGCCGALYYNRTPNY